MVSYIYLTNFLAFISYIITNCKITLATSIKAYNPLLIGSTVEGMSAQGLAAP